ncbi:DUF4365 domain-containing protein [Geofilum rhodophaeum]|uniref:DUF4365 domain-containing protein n=1 Tax=Geofilum rhodophaeum TaxID=1965019 RepID=UPI000B5255AB|nr:DUF4365 and DUF1817 domain-containing protein [Geofilum rhodophaeum]
MRLPKYHKSSKTGEEGITILKRFVETELNWIFRPNHKEYDFGIDAYFDIITDYGNVTGKTIAVQVKTGASFFTEKNEFGWIYRGEMSHLNYYLNHDIPVIIVLVNESTSKIYWTHCDPNKTEKAGSSWKITMPFNQELKLKSKKELIQYVSPVKDYASQLDDFWKVNKAIRDAGIILFIVEREDIEENSYERLLLGVERLFVSPEITKESKEKVDILINGYNDDPRELIDIPEVRKWVKSIFKRGNGWAYFLTKGKHAQFLRVMQLCIMEYKQFIDKKGQKQLDIDLVSGIPFLEEMYTDLNKFTKKNNIPIEINKEVSKNLSDFLMGKVK